MAQRNSSNVIRIATLTPFKSEMYPTVINIDGTPMKVMNGPIVIALQQAFGVPFEIVIPEDNEFGRILPNGEWSGMVGMLLRGEADMTVSGLTFNPKRLKAVNFSFPMYISDITFMTNKPEPYPKNFAIFDSFSFGVWISIGISLILISLILYFLLKRKRNFSDVVIATVGSLLDQSFDFDARQRNTVFLLIAWFLGITVLINSYKAVILSVLTFPRFVGIRDIRDLAKAAKANSIECVSYQGALAYIKWFELNDERLEAIGECLKRSIAKSLFSHGDFRNLTGKKAFIADRIDLITFARQYFVSDDFFRMNYVGIGYSKDFCCPRKLESIVHRLNEADLFPKTYRDREFVAQLRMSHKEDKKGHNLPLSLEDFTGAFILLFIGYLFSFLIFIIEILTKKVR